MKKKLLCCALLGAMSLAQSAMAQDFDDRWYISGTLGVLFPDDIDVSVPYNDGLGNAPMGGIGFGKMVTPNVSLDGEYTYSSPDFSIVPNESIEKQTLGVVARYHFIKEGRNWAPYILGGIGAEQDKNGDFDYSSTNLFVSAGGGLQANVSEHIDLRLEGGARYVFNDDFGSNGLLDLYAAASILFVLGDLPVPVVAPPPPPPVVDCSTQDDDGDGVNNCNDRCPNSQAGQAVGPDGCPVPLTIDLKGVNFDFDKATLRPDALVILDEAVAILSKYPELKVEVAGNTDNIGTEQYNQGLSMRRAESVYKYLTGKGIDASRLVGPVGNGELKPIDSNDTREGRARNRNTSLNVQN